MNKLYRALLTLILPIALASCSPVSQVIYPLPEAPEPSIEHKEDEIIDLPAEKPVSIPEAPVINTSTPTPTPEPIEDTSEKEPVLPKPTPNPSTPTPAAPKKPVPTPEIIVGEDLVIPEEFQSLPYYNADYHERYRIYKFLNPEFDFDKVILYVNIGLDMPYYTGIKNISQPHRLDVLVNKYNKLPDNFKPKLEEIPAALLAPGVGKQYLRKDAKEAFEMMHADAKELGFNITVYGTYRSIQTQHDIWNRKVKSGRSVEDVDRLNARGGHSEHHTGLAVDVIKNDYTMENSKEYEWYKDNAHLYGFIIRYPKGMEKITGYSYEPWHLRYLGPELATAVYESGLSYEEYYALYIEPLMNE